MSYETKVIYDTSPDFGDNPQTIAESGQPASVELQGLTPNTYHYTKAEIWRDGGLQNTSEVEAFTTLPAGTITLTHNQTVRNGYAYDVTYNYTSTYAPSWATLSTNGSTFQGVINSGNNTLSFHITGLTAGTAYLTSVTMGDIYAETTTVQGSIVATVVNEITITNIDSGFTSVDVDVEYIIDGGYSTGWVDYWDESGDPSTDQPEGHEVLYNGDETVTVSNLSENTAYKFRATIILADGTTRIDSNVVNASTEIPYEQRYFTIKNTSGQNNTISIETNNSNGAAQVSISTDDGTTWSSVTSSVGGTTMATLNSGERLLIKHVGALGGTSGFTILYNTIKSTGNFIVYGNLSSLTNGDSFTTTSNIPTRGLWYLFLDNQYLTSAENLYFGSYQSAEINSCASMFQGCTSLTSAPSVLQPTTLNQGCYLSMFQGCTSLTSTPTLPATTMAADCYKQMFYDCTSLTSAPQLSATTLNSSCYASMFQGCTSLTSAPQLSAPTLAATCYASMFQGCTSLTSAPQLSATTLTNACYQNMFQDCTSLNAAPSLPATTLIYKCYYEMFKGCTHLRTAPRLDHVISINVTLPLTRMFYDCSLINEIYAPSVTDWMESTKTTDWLYNVASTGTMHKLPTLNIPTDSPSGIPVGWTAANNYEMEYFTIVNRGSGTGINGNSIKITISQAGSIDYSTDNGVTWSTKSIPANTSTVITTLNQGKNVMLKATSSFLGNKTFDATDIFDIEGNIASLLTTGDFRTANNLSLSTQKWFYNCTKLINAENAVFDTCASIPQNGCKEMFYGCSSLVTAPKRLPSTVGANACESMFAQCRSLTNVPELPATITQNYCYDSMFSSCISLTEAQDELPATYIREASYRGMFYGCIRLQKSPDLRKATNGVSGAMGSMFYNCESLDTVYAPSFRSWNRYITQMWLSGVAPEGILYKPAELEIPQDTSDGVPSGWSTEDY